MFGVFHHFEFRLEKASRSGSAKCRFRDLSKLDVSEAPEGMVMELHCPVNSLAVLVCLVLIDLLAFVKKKLL